MRFSSSISRSSNGPPRLWLEPIPCLARSQQNLSHEPNGFRHCDQRLVLLLVVA
jgi:hypothetical protein